jgi:hypothetical protein
MTKEELQQTRIEHLLQLFCDDNLSDNEVKELTHFLKMSEAARRRYIATVQLCVNLADRLERHVGCIGS